MNLSNWFGLPRPGTIGPLGQISSPLMATLLAIAGTLVPLSHALGQYLQNEPKLADRDTQAAARKVNTLLNTPGAALGPEDTKIVDEFFVGYLFPIMSKHDDATLGQLAKYREILSRLYINRSKSPALRDYLVNLTIREMGKLSIGNFHPAVRYNAVLVIGGLDAEPGGRGAGAKPPVPLAKATSALLLLAEKDALNNVPIPSSVKIGALVGLRRHVRLGVDAQFKDRIQELAAKMAKSTTVPGDISADVHNWMRCQAAGVLAYHNAAAANKAAHDAIVGLMADESLSLEDRCHAARLLATMKYPGPEAIDGTATLEKLVELTLAVCKFEGKKAADIDKKMIQGAGDAGFGAGGRGGPMRGFQGGFGGGMGANFDSLAMEEENKANYEKRVMLQFASSILAAAQTIQPILADEDKTRATALFAMVQSAAEKVANRKTLAVDVLQTVVKLQSDVEALVKSWKPADVQPAETEDLDAAFSAS